MQPLRVLIKHRAAALGLRGRGVLRLSSSRKMQEGKNEKEWGEVKEKDEKEGDRKEKIHKEGIQRWRGCSERMNERESGEEGRRAGEEEKD